MKSFHHLIFLCIVISGFSSCTKDGKNASPAKKSYTKNTIQYKQVNGVAPNLLSLDVYHFREATQQKPVVIYVHGGGFALGDKAYKMSSKLDLFSSLDYIFVSINYRLSPGVYSTDPNRIMYPTHHNDVADAIKWVHDSIGNYGGNNQKIALLGHSAGAQLIALTATRHLFLPSRGINLNQIKGVACIDTEGYDVASLCNEGNQIYLNAFGQANTFWIEASPINNLVSSTGYPKFFIAKRGALSRITYSNAFISKLKSVGVSVREVTANQYGHEEINDAIGASGETIITQPLKDFFVECFQ